MRAIVILALLSYVNADDLCTRQCTRTDQDQDPCEFPSDCQPIGDNCCQNPNGTIVINLQSCSISNLTANIFRKDQTLWNETKLIERMCLNKNPLTPRDVSVDTFRGLTGLTDLFLPSTFANCPGGNEYWTHRQNMTDRFWCEGQLEPCARNGTEGCPEKSHCVDDGPGLIRCECNDGYYGYKCLKTGQFPYAIFYGILGAATILISGILWFVGRRKIGLHSKQS